MEINLILCFLLILFQGRRVGNVFFLLITGKILENLSLGHPRTDHNPPSQPPTPPSTPLSPKTNELNKYTSSIPTIPNLTITQTSSPSIPQNLSRNVQKSPLNLGKKPVVVPYTNGGGGSGSTSTGLNLTINSDLPYQMDLELLRSKIAEEKSSSDSKGSNMNTRVTRSNYLLFRLL